MGGISGELPPRLAPVTLYKAFHWLPYANFPEGVTQKRQRGPADFQIGITQVSVTHHSKLKTKNLPTTKKSSSSQTLQQCWQMRSLGFTSWFQNLSIIHPQKVGGSVGCGFKTIPLCEI